MGNEHSGTRTQHGEQIGSYKILKSLGEGCFGQVFQAQSTSSKTREMVALKKLPMHLDFTAAEIESLERLPRHENIAHLLDVVVETPLVWLALEYCDLGSLAQLLEKRGRLHAPLVQRLARHLSAALTVCHSSGVIHADIKPDNVMLSSSHDGPVAKLIDFSVAKIKKPYYQESTNTNSYDLKPILYYAAPESFERALITQKSDMFSLGLLVYTLLAGSVTPQGSHGACMMDGARAERPFCQLPQNDIDRCVHSVCSGGDALSAVLLGTLRLSPEKRSSARAVCKQLGSASGSLKSTRRQFSRTQSDRSL